MKGGIRSSDDAAALLGRPTFPVGYNTTGLFDNGDQGNNVVGIEASFHDAVDLACRKHAIGIAIRSIARQADHFLKLVVPCSAGGLEDGGRRREQRRLGEILGGTGRELRLPVRPLIKAPLPVA